MNMLLRPLLWFAARMVVWSVLALGALVFTLVIVARLDVAFFEANGMIRAPVLREAFYTQIFQIDPIFFGMLGVGFALVIGVSMLFAKSQLDYFGRLAAAFQRFASTGQVPSASQLGPFSPHVGYFFDVVARRLNGEPSHKIQAVLAEAVRQWPRQPRISWVDQAQFMFVSGLLGLFFSALCVVCYWKVNDRVVDFANTAVRFTSNTAPQFFFHEQFQIVNMMVWAVLALTTINFAITGYKFGLQISEASYAILRDLRTFMEGDHEQRLFLRRTYPVHAFSVRINGSLDKLADKAAKKAAQITRKEAA